MLGTPLRVEQLVPAVPFVHRAMARGAGEEWVERGTPFVHAFIAIAGLTLVGPVCAVIMLIEGSVDALPALGVIGLGVCAAAVCIGVAARASGAVVLRHEAGAVRLFRRRWGRESELANLSVDDVVVRFHEIEVEVLDRPVRRVWRGWAAVVHLGEAQFVLACVASRERAEHVIEEGPDWVRRRFAGDGAALVRRGDWRLW